MTKQHYQNCQAFISEGQGTYRANRLLTEEDIYGMAKTLISAKFLHYSVCFDAVETAKNYFILHLGHYEQEVFSVAYLDNQKRLIACKEMFYGTINTTVIHAREIAKCANAAAVLLAHNHPSDITEPSGSDEELTRTLKIALPQRLR
ncbi:DNA repair protein RadC [soil metagenome]